MANAREDVHSFDWNRVVFFNSKNAIMLFPVPRFDLLGILFDLLHFIVELLVDFVSCILIVLLQGRHNFAVPLKLLHDAFVELLFDLHNLLKQLVCFLVVILIFIELVQFFA